MQRHIKGFARPHHRVDDIHELMHTGDESDFLGLAPANKTLIKRPDYRVKTGGRNHAHVQHIAHRLTTIPNAPLPFELPGVMVERGHTQQGADTTAINEPQY